MSEPDTPFRSWHSNLILFAAALMPVIWVVASFFPHGRVWGINLWAFFPVWLILLLGVLTLVALAAARWLIPAPGPIATPADRRPVAVVIAAVGAAAVFWLMRNHTHFLGDGYQILSQLVGGSPHVKTTETGETILHLAVRDLLGSGPQAVLHSYQLLSVLAGAGFVAIAILFAARLFHRRTERVLFVLGALSGGYALLFFGYVENYSLFAVAVFWFLLTGALATRQKCSRLWIFLPLAVAIFLHLIGVALIPAAVYLLIANTSLTRNRRWYLVLSAAVIAVAGILLFRHYYTTNLFFRYAFVPLVPIEITAEHYTLFSTRHLLDYFNLWLLLIPGLPVVFAAHFLLREPSASPRYDIRFLGTAAVAIAFLVFILDPKLGMSRDWDLFSFVAMPLILMFLIATLSPEVVTLRSRRAVLCFIVLGAVALFSRASTQLDSGLAIERLHTYMSLDHARNRATYQVLRDYYRQRDKLIAADNVDSLYAREYPAAELGIKAAQLAQSGQTEEAIRQASRAIHLDPMYWAGYAGLGYALIQKQAYDSALVVLRIANGLNPDNPIVLHNLGYAWLWKGNYGRAESLWKRAYSLDTTQTQSLIYLARLYHDEKRWAPYVSTLKEIVQKPNAPLNSIVELADADCVDSSFADAAALYKRARDAGFEQDRLAKRLTSYPQLKNYLTLTASPDSADTE